MFSAALPLGNRTLGVDVPNSFEELIIRSEETQEDQPRAPGCVGAMTYRRVIAGLRLSVTEPVIKCVLPLRLSPKIFKRVSPRSLEPGLNFSVEHTGESGAALTTRHSTYNEDAQLDLRFRRYTKLHYESWVEFPREQEYGENLRPILVSGFDMTKDFAMMAYLILLFKPAQHFLLRCLVQSLRPLSGRGAQHVLPTSNTVHRSADPRAFGPCSQMREDLPPNSTNVSVFGTIRCVQNSGCSPE